MNEGIQDPGQSPRLSFREATVARAIERKSPELALVYRRLVGMTRPSSGSVSDPMAPLVLCHLCRELLNRLPTVLDIPKLDRDPDNHARLMQIWNTWPRAEDGSLGAPSDDAISLTRELVRDNGDKTKRRERAALMIAALDPGRAGYAAKGACERLVDIHEFAEARAHVPVPVALGQWSEVHGLPDDLTDALFAFLGPFIHTTNAIDGLIARGGAEGLGPHLLDEVAAALATHGQLTHFFERAPTAWLPTLATRKALFDAPPQ